VEEGDREGYILSFYHLVGTKKRNWEGEPA